MEKPTSNFWSTADEIANTHECYSVSSDEDDDDIELHAQGKDAVFADATGITNPRDADLEDENISSATGVSLHEVQDIKSQNKEPLQKEEGDLMSSERRARARKVVYAIYGTIIVAKAFAILATYLNDYSKANIACTVFGATFGALGYLCLCSVPVTLYTFDEDFRAQNFSTLVIFFILLSILLCLAVIYTITPPFFLGGFVFIIIMMSLEHAFHEPSSSSKWWLPPLFKNTLMGKIIFIPMFITMHVGITAGWNVVSRENYVKHCVAKQWTCSRMYYYYTKCPKWVIIAEFVAYLFAVVFMGSRTWKFQKESFLFRDEQLMLDRFAMKSAVLIGNMYLTLANSTLFFYGICFVVYVDVPCGVALILSSLSILLSQFVHMVVGNDQWYQGMLDMGCGSY